MLRVLAALTMLLACDSDRPTKPLESPAKEKPTATKVGAPPKPEPAKPEPAKPPTNDFLAELVARPQPALIGPFAKLDLDPMLTVAAARRQNPHLFETMRKGALTGPYVHAAVAWPGVEFEVRPLGQIDTMPETWIVGSIQVVLPKTGVADRLKAAWGEPEVDGGNQTWRVANNHLRVDLRDRRDSDKAEIVFMSYTPLDEFIGTDPQVFGFEQGTAILGAKGSDLQRRYGRRILDYSKIELAPLEHGGAPRLQFADSLELDEEDLPDYIVRGWALEIGDDEAVSALLEKKFGKPKLDREDERIRIYRKSPRTTFDGTTLVVGEEPGY